MISQNQGSKSKVMDWVTDAVFYQIFPDRFENGDTKNDPPNVEQWGNVPKSNNFFGGDLQGIVNKLPYLKDLGINTMYLNPIFAASTNHKYNASDYLKIDSAFGTNELFKTFVQKCHRSNIRIVIDGVFNHVGTAHWAFADVKEKGVDSKYFSWFNIFSLPVSSPSKPNYECWWGYGSLPKLMAQNPEVKTYLFEVAKYWTELGIDGWRLDVPNEVPHNFWKEWCSLVKSINPDCYIVGELWEDASPWLRGDEFDATMNYKFRDACVKFFTQDKTTPSQFDADLARTRALYPAEANFAMQNLLGSHDTERYFTLCKKTLWRMKLSVFFQMTYVGAPMVYYGDEIGMEGGKDPDCRRTMIWDERKWNKELHLFYKQLIHLRNSSEVLRRGEFRIVQTDDEHETLIYERSLKNQSAYIILSKNKRTRNITLPLSATPKQMRDGVTKEQLSFTGDKVILQVKAHSGRLLFVNY